MAPVPLLSMACLLVLVGVCKARPAEREPPDISNTVYHVDTNSLILALVDRVHKMEHDLAELREQQMISQDQIRGNYATLNAVHKIIGPTPLDCHEVRRRVPQAVSGVYMIKPRGETDPFPIYCEMDQEGSAWTVFQRRVDGSEDFNRDWRDYARGFGNVSAEFWIGNEFLHHLSKQYRYMLRVEITDWFNRKYIADYGGFEVDHKRNDFRLTVEDFLGGNATDALTYHSGSRFTTVDKDNDESDGVNCAEVHHGGWWFQACDRSNLNGLYYHEGTYTGQWDDGIEWKETDGPPFYSYKSTKMMLRPWQ
ncbi:microfibril-associated glycoprotein 4-like [Diadema setosum]|uniref:microfibril-associated glycoprotein 4-like n=1 Tax=Diadema setosum TaxID=31175 RepID=UPI003B3AD89C